MHCSDLNGNDGIIGIDARRIARYQLVTPGRSAHEKHRGKRSDERLLPHQ